MINSLTVVSTMPVKVHDKKGVGCPRMAMDQPKTEKPDGPVPERERKRILTEKFSLLVFGFPSRVRVLVCLALRERSWICYGPIEVGPLV